MAVDQARKDQAYGELCDMEENVLCPGTQRLMQDTHVPIWHRTAHILDDRECRLREARQRALEAEEQARHAPLKLTRKGRAALGMVGEDCSRLEASSHAAQQSPPPHPEGIVSLPPTSQLPAYLDAHRESA